MVRRSRNSLPRLLTAVAALALSACSTLGYYTHLARGEYAMLAARRPLDRVIADPDTTPELKARLELARAARAFASDHLDLPRNRSYTTYADLRRPYATWNVFAAPEFSVEATNQCYPLVGCLAYRGFFDEARAQAEAAHLQARGLETWIGGSAAYSTLGWFADPILNTMLRWDDDELAGTIFHELAHQRVFAKGDTEFNESFASFVQDEGVREWRIERGLAPRDELARRREDEFNRLVLDARERLRQLYASGLPKSQMRERKNAQIERLRADYASLRESQWHGRGDFDAWIAAPINNAKLLPFGLYRRWVPAFATLFAQQDSRWPAFFEGAAELARCDSVARAQSLTQLQGTSR